MQIKSIQEAKIHLEELVERAANGEPCIIEIAGKPSVKIVSLNVPVRVRRLGFLAGQFSIPDDFDQMGSIATERMFHGNG